MADAAVPEKRSFFETFMDYGRWWVLFGIFFSALQPVGTEDGDYWTVVSYRSLWGVLFGLICALVFAPIQNAANPTRKRWLTWLLVIAVWLVVKLAFAFATLGLQ